MARFQVNSWAFVAVLANFVFWLVACGGISAVTYECQNDFSASHCARGLQFEWYSVVLEFFMMLVLLFVGYSASYHKYKVAIIAFLVLVTGQLTWSARSFMVAESDAVGQMEAENGEPANKWSRAAMNAAAAGYVLLCLVNYILIWFYGTVEPMQQPQFQKDTMMTSASVVQV